MVDPEIFHPGVAVVIQPTTQYREKLTSCFRGYKGKEYIILDAPLRGGVPLNLGENTPCVVRFIYEGQIVGFKTYVLAQTRTPYPLVFLSFPDSVETSDIRKSQRYPVRINSVVAPRKLNGAAENYPVSYVLNVSAGGCLVETAEPFSLGQTLFATIYLPDSLKVNDLETIVKRCVKKGDNFRLGLEFADVLDYGYEQIQTFLQSLEAFQGKM